MKNKITAFIFQTRCSSNYFYQLKGELGEQPTLQRLSTIDEELFSLYEGSSVNDYDFIYSNVSRDSTHGNVTRKDSFGEIDSGSIDSESPRISAYKEQEVLCREVRCIEIDEVLTSINHSLEQPAMLEILEGQEKRKRETQRPTDSSLLLRRSKSCRPSLMNTSLPEESQSPNELKSESSGDYGGIPRKFSPRPKAIDTERDKIEVNSEDGQESPQRNKPSSDLKPVEEVIGMQSFIQEMKSMERNWSHIMSNKSMVSQEKRHLHPPSLELKLIQWHLNPISQLISYTTSPPMNKFHDFLIDLACNSQGTWEHLSY